MIFKVLKILLDSSHKNAPLKNKRGFNDCLPYENSYVKTGLKYMQSGRPVINYLAALGESTFGASTLENQL
jgi:hypothetical protein